MQNRIENRIELSKLKSQKLGLRVPQKVLLRSWKKYWKEVPGQKYGWTGSNQCVLKDIVLLGAAALHKKIRGYCCPLLALTHLFHSVLMIFFSFCYLVYFSTTPFFAFAHIFSRRRCLAAFIDRRAKDCSGEGRLQGKHPNLFLWANWGTRGP